MTQTLIPEKDLQNYIEIILSLRRGFDMLADHVIITDADGYILYANKAAEQHTGYVFEEMGGRKPGHLWGGHMDKSFYDNLWQTIKTDKKPFVGEVRNRHKDGSEYWQELHISPVLDEQQQIKYFIGIEPNITDRKAREQMKEEFLEAMSQQLQAPLAAIRHIVELLAAKDVINESERATLLELYHQHKDIVGFIADFLNATKSESPKA